MNVGSKATYTVYLTDEIIKERDIPYKSFKVNFEVIESGAFQYGNQTSVLWTPDTREGERRHIVDTRYWCGSFDECCEAILEQHYGRNIEHLEKD